MAEETLDGKDYIIEIDVTTPVDAEGGLAYVPVVCEVSSTFSINTGGIAISNQCAGRWGSQIPDSSTYTFSGEWQAINPKTGDPDAASINLIAQLAHQGRLFWLRRKLKDGNTGVEVYRSGVVWISRYEDTATAEDPFTFSADFVGVGEPQITGGYDFVGVLHDTDFVPITKDEQFIIVKA